MTRTFVCHAADVPANGMKQCETKGGLRLLVAHSGEQYYAYQAICPHQDVPLCEGLYDGSVLTCHQHLWQWDIKTGAALGLAEAPLEYFEVKLEDGAIYIVPPNALKMAELFAGINGQTLEGIIAIARREEYDEGTTLYRVGDPVEDLYVLESGRVNFVIGREDRTTPAGFMLRKGEVFGWAALLDNQPQRIAAATCLEKSSLLRVNGREVLKLLEADPASAFAVMRRLAALVTRYLAASGAK
ncbi:MAG: cyclic nucleotide-binding domain-containing protein [Betaproteobacteria bacterium]|nr:cyclic nucleotide-binding domain-containing protein [Betaproteobacteria bacterium]